MIKRKILLTTDLGLKETLRQIEIQDLLFHKIQKKDFLPEPPLPPRDGHLSLQ